MAEKKFDEYIEKLRAIVSGGEAFKAITESDEWKNFIQPQIDLKILKAQNDAYKEEFLTDHDAYKNQAIRFMALKELIMMFEKPKMAAKRALKELEKYGS